MKAMQHTSKQTGQISFIALLSLPLLLFLGLGALDVGYWVLTKQKLNNLAQAIVLTLAHRQGAYKDGVIPDDDMQGFIEPLTQLYFPNDETPVIETQTTKEGLTINTRINVESWYLHLFSKELAQIEIIKQVQASSKADISDLEIALVLDMSTSMGSSLANGGSRSNLAQVQRLLLQLVSSFNAQQSIALIPYNSAVTIENARWLNQPKSCVNAFEGRNPQTQSQEIIQRLFSISANDFNVLTSISCPNAVLAPLNQNKAAVKSMIENLPSSMGSTNSAPGILWGLRTLLPQWRGQWNEQDLPKANSKKMLILLTDGQDNNRDTQYLVDAGLCNRASDANISMWFIGMGLSGSLSAGGNHYFNRCFKEQFKTPDNLQDLTQAIEDIVNSSAIKDIHLQAPKEQ